METSPLLKIAAAVLVLLAGIAGGLLARRLTRSQTGETTARWANAFAGGVFLGAALIHMLPDSRDKITNVFGETDYPYFALVAGFGFLIVLLIDKVMAGPSQGRGKLVTENRKSSYPYVLALILSIHSVITGVAFGLERSFVTAAAILFAILAHKSTAAMALAISFANQNIEKVRSRNLQWIFYTTTPIGIVIGTVWSGQLQGPSADLAEGAFDGVAAGTFLYIAVVDILAEEFHREHSVRMFGFAFLGFAAMAVLAIWT
jgi:solute carrier family 39 (zinc transporter), member 1/2/3